MKNTKEIPYRGKEHGNFEEEWICREKTTEWWFVTGTFNDENEIMYGYQIVLIKVEFGLITPWIIQFSLINFASGKHYYFYQRENNDKNVIVDEKTASYKDTMIIQKDEIGMHITGTGDAFSFDLHLDYGKGAFWHGDNGLILMGNKATKNTTIYFSYPNMPTNGTITCEGRPISVNGKSWLDKQGGPFSLIDRNTHWEWFSLRFFDEEEIMIFSFPQNDYWDASYIQKDKKTRLNELNIKEDRIILINGLKYASGWQLHVPGIKDEKYTIHPIMDGQLKGVYFEQVCYIFNQKNERVGLCFAELLPGVRNTNFISKMI